MKMMSFILSLIAVVNGLPYKPPSQMFHVPNAHTKQYHPFFDRFPHDNLLDNCTENYFEQVLDHYNFRPAVNGQLTYQQRYFVCGGKNWTPNSTIFYYTGNEADVELYLNATGLMWENADAYNAIMVFAEHRYFGKSLPFGSNEQDMKNDYLYYLSSDQALADYAVLMEYLKNNWNSWDSPVIGFGGSYGGMLCTWFRIKFPQWMDGCIAASAPIVSFMGQKPALNVNYFAELETYDCKSEGGSNDLCAQNIQSSWDMIFTMANSESGRQELADVFRLCSVPQNYNEGVNVAYWISDGLGYMTMGSYPYPSSYMLNGNGLLPAYPMRVGCGYISQTFNNNNDLLAGIRDMIGVFYNYTGNVTCFDTNANANNATQIDGELWNYLYCTEIFQPFGQTGVNDMFWNAPWNPNATAQGCKEEYNVVSRPYWAQQNYGGYLISLAGTSNIVFSNGGLDPWRGGGITSNISDTLVGIVIPDVGHHIDLFFSNVNDTDAVKQARQFELEQISTWIKKRIQYNKHA